MMIHCYARRSIKHHNFNIIITSIIIICYALPNQPGSAHNSQTRYVCHIFSTYKMNPLDENDVVYSSAYGQFFLFINMIVQTSKNFSFDHKYWHNRSHFVCRTKSLNRSKFWIILETIPERVAVFIRVRTTSNLQNISGRNKYYL